ncbi:helix-turn-helix domain-containing protein [Methanococcoides seepicolus]|uniref:ATP-binding protein n=1 Tax=Methanococcoides seepicolus TaxID=2828780 RepID=A0A9E4ZI26_9EURY|nr:ATP-binding protein [Methanococcoides seepicolus]MCM1987932.1 ATP-binding protein [Methanococcoides seepicolus]
MPYCKENDVLVDCDECIVHILRKIQNKSLFEIKMLRSTGQESRKLLLEFIIRTLYRLKDYDEAPNSSRKEVTNILVEHGQFTEEEIDNIFEEYSNESMYYSNEFFEEHPNIDLKKVIHAEISSLGSPSSEEYPFPLEKRYDFPFSGCDLTIAFGLCPINIETLSCPDCGMEITNTPDNVGWPSQDLICPSCSSKKENEFDTRGIIISGNPKHHGSWKSQQPEFKFMGTDYFGILHPKCKESKRPDGKGVMLVNGIWTDSTERNRDRIVLSLECRDCGAKNALKPFLKDNKIPVLNIHKAEILKFIEKGEYEKLEFKPYLTTPPDGYKLDKNQKYKIAKSIAGFINSEGGHLLIGVSNCGSILGLDNEYSNRESRLDRDDFNLKLIRTMEKYIPKEVLNDFLIITYHEIFGKDICCIEIKKSEKPFCLKNGEFFIRFFASTPLLSGSQKIEYIKIHWGNIE